MAHYYFDSSALVKRYVAETGTAWVNRVCAASSGHTIYTVRISGAEIVSALFRRAQAGAFALSDAQAAAASFKADFASHFQIVEVTTRLVDNAMALAERHHLRGYDAVQLSAALELQTIRASLALPTVTFVCADTKLNLTAVAESLSIENPNAYP
ncbi:MAG TPA: type II toxin-antitoxin system VapC family toxin [Anaerolineae bacterium]|nr:type II toxin-antitoxin system VapC family toxin [Anaerolineae bacterium]